jgi:hypothetical protein
MVWCRSLFINFVLANNRKIEVINLPHRQELGISRTATHTSGCRAVSGRCWSVHPPVLAWPLQLLFVRAIRGVLLWKHFNTHVDDTSTPLYAFME